MKGLLLLLLRSTSPWSPLVVTVGALLFFMRVLRRINIRTSQRMQFRFAHQLRSHGQSPEHVHVVVVCCLYVVGEVLYNITAASDSQPL